MFSGPVTTMTSMPALASSLRARATRCSYSAFGNADSEPCRMPLLSMSEVSDEMSGRGVEGDTETGCAVGMHGSRHVRDARDGIVDQTVGAIEFGKGRRRRAGDVKRRGGGGTALVHLANHERNAAGGQPPRRRDRWCDAAELDQFEVRKNPTAVATDPRDVVGRRDAFIEHHRHRTSPGKVIDGRPVSGRNGLFNISEIVGGQRIELPERFGSRPTSVGVGRNLDLRPEAGA